MFCESREGLLSTKFASRKTDDIKHLNKNGIFTLKELFKESVISLRRRPVKNCEVPWCYPSHHPQSPPMGPFDHSKVPANCVLRSSRSFSLSSCGSDRGGTGLSPQVSSFAEPRPPGVGTDDSQSHSLIPSQP